MHKDGNKDNQKGGCYICTDTSHKDINWPKKCEEQSVNPDAVMLSTDEKEQIEAKQDDAQMMMSTLRVSDDQKKDSDEVYRDFIDTMKIDGKPVQCLYDTGATKAAPNEGLEKPEQYTGKFAWCKFARLQNSR